MKNLQSDVSPGVKEGSPATSVDTQRENTPSVEQRDVQKQPDYNGDSDVSTMSLAAPKETPGKQASKTSATLESQEENAAQRVTESTVDQRGSNFKDLLDYYEKEVGESIGLEEKPHLEDITRNSTTMENQSNETGVPVDPRTPAPSPEITSSDGTKEPGLLSSLVGTTIVPMVAPLVTPLMSVVTVMGEGTAAVLVGRGEDNADETTEVKGLDPTATTESVVESTSTKEAPNLGHSEQLETQVVASDRDLGGIAKMAAHVESVQGARGEELEQGERQEKPAVPATFPTPIITKPDYRTTTALETEGPQEEDDGGPVELEAQDETVVEAVLVPKPTPAPVQEGEQGSAVAPQQQQQQQVPEKKEKKKKYVQKLCAAVQRLFKSKITS